MGSLAHKLLNNRGLEYLALDCEKDEIKAVLQTTAKASPIKLRRTYNQLDLEGRSIKFWRVVGPASHPNYESDLSIEGLKQWGVI